MGSGRRLPEDPLLHGGNRRLAELVSRRLLAHHRHVARAAVFRGRHGQSDDSVTLRDQRFLREAGRHRARRHRHERQIAAVGRIGNGQQARASARIAVTAFIVYPSVAINARTAPLATKVRNTKGALAAPFVTTKLRQEVVCTHKDHLHPRSTAVDRRATHTNCSLSPHSLQCGVPAAPMPAAE